MLRLATDIPRASLEFYQLLWNFKSIIQALPRGNGQVVVTLPGYGGGDGTMYLTRHFLNKLGYKAVPLKLGRNYEPPEERIKCMADALAYRKKMTGLVVERIKQINQTYQQPVTLIGWSMGGLFALDSSHKVPDLLRNVITMGSPFGDPRGTSAFAILRRLNRSQIPVDEQDFQPWVDMACKGKNNVPITVLYSPNDGIVSTNIAKIGDNKHINYIEVDSSHVGFAINLQALQAIATELHKHSKESD